MAEASAAVLPPGLPVGAGVLGVVGGAAGRPCGAVGRVRGGALRPVRRPVGRVRGGALRPVRLVGRGVAG